MSLNMNTRATYWWSFMAIWNVTMPSSKAAVPGRKLTNDKIDQMCDLLQQMKS